MQQVISKGCVEIEVFSDLFKLRNSVNLKRNPSKKMEIPGGCGGGGCPQMILWKGNSKGVGVKTKEPSMGGMNIFWNHTLSDSVLQGSLDNHCSDT